MQLDRVAWKRAGLLAVRLGQQVALLIISTVLASPALAQSAFKITFAAKNRLHGRVWNGGVEDAGRLRSMLGWHLHDEDRLRQPARWDIVTQSVGGDVASPGVILSLNGPETAPFRFFTRRGDTEFTPSDMPYGETYFPPGLSGNVAIERVPASIIVSSAESEDDDPAILRTRSGEFWLAWVSYRTIRREGDYLDGADRVMVAHSSDGRVWSKPIPVTSRGDHFRVALGEDSKGRIWCVYGLQKEMGSGNFDLFAKRLDASGWSEPIRLSSDPRPDAFHRLATAPDGGLYLVWAGFRDSPAGGPPQSDILLRRFDGLDWGPTVNLTDSTEDDWEPDVAADSSGRAWVAWDAYRKNGYDLLLRSVTPEGEGAACRSFRNPVCRDACRRGR